MISLEILDVRMIGSVCHSLCEMVTGMITQEIRIFQFFDLNDWC